jgi:pimeloyl-ACP methyl ester carboxylesterase
MPSNKPTFLFVPGAWHFPAYFDPLISYLSDHGYPSVAVTLPAVNSSPAVTSLQPDVDAAAAALATLLDDGTDVVVVMHSYGGMVGTGAVGQVVYERRAAADAEGGRGGKTGRVKRLVYVTAHVPHDGQTLFQAIEGTIEGPPLSISHVGFEVGVRYLLLSILLGIVG